MDPLAFIQSSQVTPCTLKMVPEAKAQGHISFVNIQQGATEAYLDRKQLQNK